MPQMQSTTRGNSRRNGSLEIALPEPALAIEQDAEWCVVRIGDEWRQIRFHDYHDVYALPGLYERLFYDILQCDSPATVRQLLEKETRKGGTAAEDLRVLDLGAGNGMVGEEFAEMGVKSIVGVDIIAQTVNRLSLSLPFRPRLRRSLRFDPGTVHQIFVIEQHTCAQHPREPKYPALIGHRLPLLQQFTLILCFRGQVQKQPLLRELRDPV